MSNISSLADVRKQRAQAELENSRHSSGTAICLDCKHEWVAVVPTGTLWLECPKCTLTRGRYKFQHSIDGAQWICHCGNDLFHIMPTRMYCPNCGKDVEGAC